MHQLNPIHIYHPVANINYISKFSHFTPKYSYIATKLLIVIYINMKGTQNKKSRAYFSPWQKILRVIKKVDVSPFLSSPCSTITLEDITTPFRHHLRARNDVLCIKHCIHLKTHYASAGNLHLWMVDANRCQDDRHLRACKHLSKGHDCSVQNINQCENVKTK